MLLATLAVRLLWSGRTELAHDEPFTVYWSQRPIGELWAMLRTENNPPLHFLLTKAWSLLVPFEPAWLRVPSAVCSALVVWPLFLLARALQCTRTAVVATLLFTFSNYHQGFGHEVRAYALFTLLAVICMWQLWRLAMGAPRALLWHTLAAIAMVYTHFFGWLVLGIAWSAVLVVPAFRSARGPLLRSTGLVVLAYLPYASVFMQRAGSSVAEGTWLEAPHAEELYNMIWRWSNAPVLAVTILAVIIVAVARDRPLGTGMRLGLIWTFLPLIGMFALSFVVPMFLDRYLVYAAPGFALLAATGLTRMLAGTRWAALPAAAVVLGMALTFTPWSDDGRHPSRVVAQVEAWCGGSCTTEVHPAWYRLNYQAADDLEGLRRDLAQVPVGPSTVSADHGDPDHVIVVDATGGVVGGERSWRKRHRVNYPQVDSVEADHKVWVYRFGR